VNNKLADRIASYEAITNYKLLPRVPLVISINGRGFSKITSLLDKPYSKEFGECILNTMMRLCVEVEGTLFGYQHNDEIVLVIRNDQNENTEAWFGNSIQKICSATSSIATLHFNKCVKAIGLNLTGEPIFTSQIFAVPNVVEAINTIVFKQQHNFHTSIQFACFYELLKKYDKGAIKDLLVGLNIDERGDLLLQECGVNFHEYPSVFRRGAACYRVPKIGDGGEQKYKWTVNDELPIFTKSQSFLTNLFRDGADIFHNGE
jgi:tRNA(His) 5'-end guanylyltransferase